MFTPGTFAFGVLLLATAWLIWKYIVVGSLARTMRKEIQSIRRAIDILRSRL